MLLCVETRSIIVDALDESIREVFSMMVGSELQKLPLDSPVLRNRKANNASREMTVVLGLSGELDGSLSLSMPESAALLLTKCMIDIDPLEVDQEVVDAVGELGNMVVGGAKRRMVDFKLTMSLPSVIRAGIDQIRFCSKTTTVKLSYRFDEHIITAMIALRI